MNREKEIFEELFVRYPALEGIREDIKSAYDVICACFDRGGKLLICGNGGSAADAQHIVGELMKILSARSALPHIPARKRRP